MSKLIKVLAKPIVVFVRQCRDFVFCQIYLGYYNPTWQFRGFPNISRFRGSRISIGSNFIACSLAKYNSIGVFQRVILKTVEKGAQIIIGDNVGVSGCTISSSKLISIGDNTMIGSGVLITDSDAHPIDPAIRSESKLANKADVVIERNVFIGARSIILKGVTIGEGSVIGAGSVVVSDIPRMCIAAGNPARKIREIVSSK